LIWIYKKKKSCFAGNTIFLSLSCGMHHGQKKATSHYSLSTGRVQTTASKIFWLLFFKKVSAFFKKPAARAAGKKKETHIIACQTTASKVF